MRGYWNAPKDLSKENVVNWFSKQTQRMGFSNLKDALYFQQDAGINLVFLLVQIKNVLMIAFVCATNCIIFMETVEKD